MIDKILNARFRKRKFLAAGIGTFTGADRHDQINKPLCSQPSSPSLSPGSKSLMSSSLLPPDIQALLASNRPPLESQIPVIRNIIATTHARLATLRAESGILSSRLDQLAGTGLREHKEELGKQLAVLDDAVRVVAEQLRAENSLLSAIRRIPPEILCEIFKWVAQRGCWRYVVGSPVVGAPWHLTHICRGWRNVARSYPRLWGTLSISHHVPVHQGPRFELCFPEAAIETQLALSRPATLTILLDVYLYPNQQTAHLEKLLRLLTRESNRWLNLFIGCMPRSTRLLASALSVIRGQLAQLDTVRLTLEDFDEARYEDLWSLFATAPKLRKVEFETSRDFLPRPAGIIPLPNSFSIPQHQLTHLAINSSPGFIFHILLQAADTLVCAELKVGRAPHNPSHSLLGFPSALHLPRLETLYMDSDWCFACFFIPNIRSLGITDPKTLPKILEQSQCEVKALTLHEADMTSEEILTLLSKVPSLTTLYVDFRYSDDEVVEGFIEGMKTPCVCSKLSKMDLRFGNYLKKDYSPAIGAIVHCRKELGNPSLKKIFLSCPLRWWVHSVQR
ncbi:hypothetical protein R3P38DRAFT_3450943 [Favolaschia claudopus]|uniref:F-box domain-containing protein n=1 Tax=Favolaschia claudopus TaxID=2862362 RepID=A0AAV9ZL82_9AGAR